MLWFSLVLIDQVFPFISIDECYLVFFYISTRSRQRWQKKKSFSVSVHFVYETVETIQSHSTFFKSNITVGSMVKSEMLSISSVSYLFYKRLLSCLFSERLPEGLMATPSVLPPRQATTLCRVGRSRRLSVATQRDEKHCCQQILI